MSQSQSPYEVPPGEAVHRRPERPINLYLIGVIGAGLLALVGLICLCLVAGSVLFLKTPPTPAAPAVPTAIVLIPTNPGVFPTVTALVPVSPTLPNSGGAVGGGQYVNPYESANLTGMSIIQIDLLDQSTSSYTRVAQVTGADLNAFAVAFNVSVQAVSQDPSCPDHLRLTITRADNSVLAFGVCLKGVVTLRNTDLFGGLDLPMYPGFTDTISKYLPDNYKQLLTFQ